MHQREAQFRIRRAVVGDEQVLRALRLRALSGEPRAFGSTYERELARTVEDWQRWFAPGVTFILEANGEPAGMVAGVRDEQDESVAWLMAMWVQPSLRGAGAAGALVSAVKTWAAEIGASELRLKVIDDNDRARRFYEREGFRATGRSNPREKDGATEVEMAFVVRGVA